MDREIAELAKLAPEEVYSDFNYELEDEPQFVPTPECGSDCYDNECHSTLCPHSPEPNFNEELPF